MTFDVLNDFITAWNQISSKYITEDLGSDAERHFGIIFVKHTD